MEQTLLQSTQDGFKIEDQGSKKEEEKLPKMSIIFENNDEKAKLD